jgi:hypothetical protein
VEEAGGIKKTLFLAGLQAKIAGLRTDKEFAGTLKHRLWDTLVFNPIKKRLGLGERTDTCARTHTHILMHTRTHAHTHTHTHTHTHIHKDLRSYTRTQNTHLHNTHTHTCWSLRPCGGADHGKRAPGPGTYTHTHTHTHTHKHTHTHTYTHTHTHRP